MPSIRQSIRSSTASKRPTSAIADGQIALNTASGTPGIFFKDNANNIIKAGPAHYGASAPNSSPAVGGSTGNSIGEAWLDSSLTPAGWKIWNGSAWVNATPLSSDTVQGLVELATNAEVQAGVDTARAVTAAGLQSKVSDSISTTSSSGIASSSAVKTAYDLANAALPKSGGIITGNLEIGSTGSFTFEGATADGFETTLAVVDPTADRTITFPDITGTVITTADTGTVTSTMIANGTIVDADINSSAAIAFSKLASLASANILVGNASGVPTSTTVSGDVTITNAGVTAIASNVIVNADINSSAAIAYSKLALASGIVNTDISASAAVAYSKLALSNSIVNADINSAAAIAGTKISPDFGSQNLTTTGNITATNHIAASGTATTPSIQVGNGTTYKPGVYSPGTDQVAISTNGVGRLFVDSSGRVGVGTSSPSSFNSAANQFVVGSGSGSQGVTIYTGNSAGNQGSIFFADGTTGGAEQAAGYLVYEQNANYMAFGTLNTERMRLDSSGRVGIGTTGPTAALSVVSQASTTWFTFRGTTAGFDYGTFLNSGASVIGYMGAGGSATTAGTSADLAIRAEANLLFTAGGNTERARIDSSGRLLVGTSTARSNLTFGGVGISPLYQVESTGAESSISITRNATNNLSNARLVFAKNNSATLGTNVLVDSGEVLGEIAFNGNDGTNFIVGANITGEVDGTPGSNDMPGRLVFSTTADGASSPTERMRIANNGAVGVGDTTPASNTLRASFRGPSNIESALPVVSIVRTNNSGGGTGVAETGLDVRIPNTFNGAGEVKGINVFAAHNVGTSATYGIFAEAGGNPSYGNIYSGYFKVTQPDTNGGVVNYAVYAQANSTIGISSSGYSIGVTSETNNYVNNQNFRAVSLYTGASTQTVLSIIRNTSAIGSITTSTTATAYNTSSDYRLKENVIPIPNGIVRCKQLKPSRFNFIADPNHIVEGFIAHEAQAVVPECVTGTKDAVDADGNPVYQGIDQSKLVPLLTAALQEAIAKIEALETRLSALEGN